MESSTFYCSNMYKVLKIKVDSRAICFGSLISKKNISKAILNLLHPLGEFFQNVHEYALTVIIYAAIWKKVSIFVKKKCSLNDQSLFWGVYTFFQILKTQILQFDVKILQYSICWGQKFLV